VRSKRQTEQRLAIDPSSAQLDRAAPEGSNLPAGRLARPLLELIEDSPAQFRDPLKKSAGRAR
jgi:hypothetical protein